VSASLAFLFVVSTNLELRIVAAEKYFRYHSAKIRSAREKNLHIKQFFCEMIKYNKFVCLTKEPRTNVNMRIFKEYNV